MRPIVALLLACVVVVPGRLAADDAVERGKKMSLAAVDLARSGSYTEAIELFEKAYVLTGDSMILYNIGQVAARLGDLSKAKESLERFLVEEKEPEALQRGRQALRDVLARWPGWLRVTTSTQGALVEIDGKPVGKTPLEKPIELSPGKHAVKVIVPGKHAFERQIDVAASEAIEIAAVLDDDPALVSEPPAPLLPAARYEAPAPIAANDLTGKPVVLEKKGLSTLSWVLIGTGAAAVVAGGIVAGVLLASQGGGNPSEDGVFHMTKPLEVGR